MEDCAKTSYLKLSTEYSFFNQNNCNINLVIKYPAGLGDGLTTTSTVYNDNFSQDIDFSSLCFLL